MTDICANYHGGNGFSESANLAIAPRKRSDCDRILLAIGNGEPATSEELEKLLEMKHQTCAARISEMKRDGYLMVLSHRKTSSGCNAGVNALTPIGREGYRNLITQ